MTAPLSAPSPILSAKPVALDAPERGTALEVRVSAPATGDGLPVLVFAHGFGWSLDGYAPLTDHWAAHGFVVVQATHLDSRRLAIPADDPRTPTIWRQRVLDAKHALDQLDRIEASIPGLAGRVDRDRIAAVGHSFGAQTTSVLLGARVRDADGRPGEDLSDARVRAGVLLAPAGSGGDDLSPFAAEQFPFMNPSFETLTTRALVVVGDRDDSPLTVRGPEWTADPYHLSPGAEALLTLFGGEHSLGGIPGWEVAETTDESPARVALVQRVTTAWLRHALDLGSGDWEAATAELATAVEPLGRIETKQAAVR
jgi:predicted dienelactone hydrolase